MKKYTIAVLAGDGIGPEITAEALKVIDFFNASKFSAQIIKADFGAGAYFEHGHPFPEQTIKICDDADIIIKGPIGLNFEDSQKIPVAMQPERAALLPLRNRYNTYANYRPIYLPQSMSKFSPLKANYIADGIDILMIRELCGGLYFGDKKTGVTKDNLRYVSEELYYSEDQIQRIAEKAFEAASKRKKKIHHIHKSNVLKSSVLWTEVVTEVAKKYPDITVENMLVDAAATHLCLNPGQFDVMLMENMFGDILSDQGGGILGSLGLMPSACVGENKIYYEPSHGSAPDIANKNIANPYSMIASVALMLDLSMNLKDESLQVWQALEQVYKDGYVTNDFIKAGDKDKLLSTAEFGNAVVAKLKNL